MTPGQSLTKVWRLKNTGSAAWGPGYQLAFRSGSPLGAPGAVPVPATAPGQSADISVPLRIPSNLGAGTHTGYWQLRNSQGTYFGDQVWVKLSIAGSQPGGGNAVDGGQVVVQAPAEVAPGQRFTPEIRWLVSSGQLRQDRGDMLRFYGGTNYSDFPHIAVRGTASGGQTYTFRFPDDHPLVAPTSEGSYESIWRVWANGGWVGPEIAIRFRVYGGASNRPPAAPQLVSPGDWGVFIGQTPTLCARAGGDPDGDPIAAYYFEIYDSAQLWNSGWTSSSCVMPQGLGAYGFQWRVKVRDSRGLEGPFSQTWHFNIYSTKVTVKDLSFDPPGPSNARIVTVRASIEGCGGQSLNRRLLLNSATDGSASGEWRELAGWLDSPTLVQPWETFHSAEGKHLIRLEVKGCDGTTTIADRQYQLLRGAPSRPTPLGPARGFWSNERRITFRWQPALRASGYSITVGTSPDPRQAPLFSASLNETEYTATFTQDYPKLYWSVVAVNEFGETDTGSDWWFAIDQVAPSSAINLDRTSALVFENQFPVSWDSSDAASGIASHDIQVRVLPDGQWVNWLTDYPYASAIFNGQPGRTYELRSRARDIAGNHEAFPEQPDARVQIDPTRRPPEPWLNTAFSAKRNLLVVNRMGDRPLPARYPIELRFDATTTPSAAQIVAAAGPSGRDLRIAYNNQAEIPHQLTAFGPDLTSIWFPAQAPIAAGASSGAYALYYGNPQASSPGSAPEDIFIPLRDTNTRLLLYLNEGRGTTTADVSGNGNHGRLVGNTTQPWPEGKLWTGARFDGASYVRVEDSPSLRITGRLLVEAWVRPAVIDHHTRNIVAKLSPIHGVDSGAFRLFLRGGYPLFDIYSPHDMSRVEGPKPLEPNRWYHLAAVYDLSTLRLFVDGIEVSSRPYTKSINPAQDAWIAVGSSGYLNENFIGDIDQVKIGAGGDAVFPFAQVRVNAVAGAGEQLAQQRIEKADLSVRDLIAVPGPDGGLIVQTTLTNQSAVSTTNEVITNLLVDRTPADPNDANERIGTWVNAPLSAQTSVTLTQVVSARLLAAPVPSGGAPADQPFTLLVQVEAAGSNGDSDSTNNTVSDSRLCAAPADGAEPDNVAAQAGVVTPGVVQEHSLHRAGDADWAVFTALAGRRYTIQTSPITDTGDTILTLYEADGTTMLASNDDAHGARGSEIAWQARATGRYYLRVQGWNPQAGGCGHAYRFLLQQGPAAPYAIYLPLARR